MRSSVGAMPSSISRPDFGALITFKTNRTSDGGVYQENVVSYLNHIFDYLTRDESSIEENEIARAMNNTITITLSGVGKNSGDMQSVARYLRTETARNAGKTPVIAVRSKNEPRKVTKLNISFDNGWKSEDYKIFCEKISLAETWVPPTKPHTADLQEKLANKADQLVSESNLPEQVDQSGAPGNLSNTEGKRDVPTGTQESPLGVDGLVSKNEPSPTVMSAELDNSTTERLPENILEILLREFLLSSELEAVSENDTSRTYYLPEQVVQRIIKEGNLYGMKASHLSEATILQSIDVSLRAYAKGYGSFGSFKQVHRLNQSQIESNPNQPQGVKAIFDLMVSGEHRVNTIGGDSVKFVPYSIDDMEAAVGLGLESVEGEKGEDIHGNEMSILKQFYLLLNKGTKKQKPVVEKGRLLTIPKSFDPRKIYQASIAGLKAQELIEKLREVNQQENDYLMRLQELSRKLNLLKGEQEELVVRKETLQRQNTERRTGAQEIHASTVSLAQEIHRRLESVEDTSVTGITALLRHILSTVDGLLKSAEELTGYPDFNELIALQGKLDENQDQQMVLGDEKAKLQTQLDVLRTQIQDLENIRHIKVAELQAQLSCLMPGNDWK